MENIDYKEMWFKLKNHLVTRVEILEEDSIEQEDLRFILSEIVILEIQQRKKDKNGKRTERTD